MSHQPGWVELYEILEAGAVPARNLVDKCMSSHSGLGETMLHWYAIEGEPHVLSRLIDLGFDVNVQNEFGRTPLMECSIIGIWDNAKVLYDRGSDLSLRDGEGMNFFEVMDEYAIEIPEWLVRTC